MTLIAVQGLTALFAYGVIRANLVEQGKDRLEATTQVFMRQLNVLSERVSDDVEILSLDYALRKAVAENDRGTALSALRNHGNRVGATRMSIVGLDGTITTDTASEAAQGTAFPFPDLLDSAVANDQGTALAVLDGVIYWIVVVPVRAPDPVAFIAADVPVNDALLERLRELSLVTHSLALATPSTNGDWTVVAKTAGFAPVVQLPSPATVPKQASILSTEQSGESLAMTARLATSETSAPVLAILDYPLEEALSPYRAVIVPMLLVLGGALLVALTVAMLIAHGVSQPLEALAATARRIAKGDYSTLPAVKPERRDRRALLGARPHDALDRRSRERAPRRDRFARARPQRCGEGERGEIAVPLQHEPRAAHAVECDPRLLGSAAQTDDGPDRRFALRRICAPHLRQRLAPARSGRRDARSVAGRGRPAPDHSRRRVKPSGLLSASIEAARTDRGQSRRTS